MRPSVWTGAAKIDIYNKLIASRYDDVQAWADLIRNTDDSKHFGQFCKLTNQHDQYRNLDFATTFPEMAVHLQ
jgi:hypothetical protein